MHRCSGSPQIGGPHIEIFHTPSRRRIHQVTASDNTKFKGSLKNYFEALISINNDPIPVSSCWRIKDGIPLCPGKRMDNRYLVVSLPLLYSVEIGDERITCQDATKDLQIWDFPPTLMPDTDFSAENYGLIYDLVGLALRNLEGNHFIARYASIDRGTIYTYNDMEHKGCPVEEPGAKFSTHMFGKNIHLPDGFVVYQVFHLLRGGAKAQDKFFDLRTSALTNRFNFHFSTSNLDKIFSMTYHSEDFVKLDSRKRTWLFNPFRSTTLEYVSRNPPTDNVITDGSLDPESEEETIPKKPGTSGTRDSPYHISPAPSSNSSLPDSLFGLDCRCGIVGDGNINYRADEHGEAIQCDECKNWSHVACQRDGRASNLTRNSIFICDFCDPRHILPLRVSERK